MPFHFSLETLLRFRQSLERQKELRVMLALRRVAETRLEIEAVDRCAAEVRSDQLEEMRRKLPAAQLHFDRLRLSVLQQRREELECLLSERQSALETLQKEYWEAHRARESVEGLRSEWLQVYRQEESRREQKRLDDLFLLRRHYLRR
jgi:flagellar export protein FliJ